MHTVDFGSFGSSGLSVRGDDPGLETLPRDVEGARRGFAEEERARLEGFRGTVGDSRGLAAGEEGLLPIKTSWVGGMGVLDGRWARSKGKAGNGLVGIGIGIGCEAPLGTASEGGRCGTLGLRLLSVILRLSISSSSSIVGK